MRLLFPALLATVSALAADSPARTARATARGPVSAPFAFRAAGIYPPVGVDSVRVRASADGVRWSDWMDTSREDGAGAFAWFESGQRWIETSPASEVLFIDPGTATGKPEARRFAVDAPPVVTREQWGCPPETCAFRGGSPSYTTVTHLVVHHTAGANNAADWPAVMRSIWALHVNGNGWSDVGYNYVVDPNGVLYEGRQGGPGVLGAHFSSVNSGTMGVSLMGTYSNLRPTDAALSTLKQMLAWHAQRWKLDPGTTSMHAASQLRLNVISGHRDAGLSPRASGGTECPGNGLYVLLPALRAEVRRILTADGVVFPEAQTQCEDGTPCIRGVVTSGTREAVPVVAGSWISIYGTNLASGTATASDGTLPTALGGVSLTVNGTRQAPLLYVSPTQINALLPSGVNTGSARIVVTRDGIAAPEALFWVTEAAPSIFVTQNHDDGRVNSAEAPARAGRAVIVYLTGAGPSRLPWSAHVGGREAERLFLGPTPGFLGLYQANLLLPSDLVRGAHDLTVTVAGATSAATTLHVAP